MKLAFKTIVVAIGQFASSMERIVVIVILSRTLSKYDYGTYQQVWLFFSLILPLFTLGLPGSVLYFIPRSEVHERKTIAFQTLLLLQIVGVIFSLGTFITAPLVASQFGNPDLVLYLRIFSIYPLFSLAPKMLNLLLVAEGKPILATFVSIVVAITVVATLSLPSILGLPLEYTFYAANAGAFLLLISVLTFMLYIYRDQEFHWNSALLREQIAYSVPLGLASMLGVFSRQLNKVVVSSSFSPDVYAVYVNGAFELPFIGLLTGSLMTVLIPEFVLRFKAGKSVASIWHLWNEVTLKTALLLFPIGVVLFIFAEDFMVIMFSDKYIDSTPVFRVYLGLVLLRVTQYGAILQALGLTRLILYTSIIGLSANLVLSFVLVRVLGVLGPAWANVITTYLWALIYLVILSRYFNIKFGKIMPWKGLARTLVIAVAAGLVAFPVLWLPYDRVVVFTIGMIVFGLCYLALLLLTHTVDLASVRLVGREISLRISAYTTSQKE